MYTSNSITVRYTLPDLFFIFFILTLWTMETAIRWEMVLSEPLYLKRLGADTIYSIYSSWII